MKKIIFILTTLIITTSSNVFSQVEISNDQFVYITVDYLASFHCECKGMIVREIGTETIALKADSTYKKEQKCTVFIKSRELGENKSRAMNVVLIESVSKLVYDYHNRKRKMAVKAE
jgi:hypothetical protein